MSTGMLAAGAVSHATVAPAVTTTAAVHTAAVGAHAVAAAATAAVTVVAAAAAAVILAKAAISATEAGAEAMIRLDAVMKRQAQDFITATEMAEDWRAAAAAVGARNAALRSLGGSAERLGVDLPLPPPLGLAGRNLCQIRDWCVAADKEIELAKGRLATATVESAVREIRAAVPALPAESASAFAERYAAALDVAPAAVYGRPTGPTKADAASSGMAAVEVAVGEVLNGLPEKLDTEQYRTIMALAARATSQRDLGLARTLLTELRQTVRVARETAGRRAADRLYASRMLDLFESPAIEPVLGGGDHGVVAALRRVAGGDTLDKRTRDEAERVYVKASEAARRAFLLERTTEVLTEFGYDVRLDNEGVPTGRDRLKLTGGRLEDATANLIVSADSIAYHMLRVGEHEDDQSASAEVERCAGLTDHMRQLPEVLRNLGLPVSTTFHHGADTIQRAPDTIRRDSDIGDERDGRVGRTPKQQERKIDGSR
ncbi:hypothetical protein [Dactylosporangium sp. CA-139066]|uniref:hypothetical protein n=1 Tax=Dactylosporangium sp. CA-139066 TaxID=3239930 RepID=UPI003D9382F8